MAASASWAISASNAVAVASPITIVLTSAQVAADILYVFIRLGANATAVCSTPTDTAGQTYVALAAQADTGTLHERMYRVQNISAQSASANTLTISWTGGNSSYQVAVLEVTGADTGATPEDLVFTPAVGSSVTPLVAAQSTSNTGLLLGFYSTNTTAVTWSVPLDNAAGNAMAFQIPPSGTFRIAVVSLASAAATSYSPRITKSQSEAWIATALLVKDPTASGTTATIASTLLGLTVAGVAVETRTAAVAATLARFTIAAAAIETRTAVVASTLRGLTIAAVAAETRTAVIASTLPGLTIAAVAGQVVATVATIATTLSGLTIAAAGGQPLPAPAVGTASPLYAPRPGAAGITNPLEQLHVLANTVPYRYGGAAQMTGVLLQKPSIVAERQLAGTARVS